MNNIKQALTRKFGPLPAWVWAIVGGVALYWYRNRAGAPQATTATQTTGEVVDSTATPAPPVSIGPGEAVYDPSTGKLTNAPSEPLPPNPPQPPVTLETANGGEAVYDPNTGRLLTPAGDPPAPSSASAPVTKKTKYGGVSGPVYGKHGASGGYKFLGSGRYIGAGGKIVSWKQAHLPQNPARVKHAPSRPRSGASRNQPARSRAQAPRRASSRPRPTPSPNRPQSQRNYGGERQVVRAHPAPRRRRRH